MAVRHSKYLHWVESVRDWARRHPHLDFSKMAYMTDNDLVEVMKAAGATNQSEAGTAVWQYLHPEEIEPDDSVELIAAE